MSPQLEKQNNQFLAGMTLDSSVDWIVWPEELLSIKSAKSDNVLQIGKFAEDLRNGGGHEEGFL